jgi:flagellar motor switch protein FliN/FliY
MSEKSAAEEIVEQQAAEPAHKVELSIVDSDADQSGQVKEARFSALQNSPMSSDQGSIDMLADVELDLTVELGRTSIPVKEVLQLGPGSIVELHKLAGEPVDILVNGKMIARGEVVVVDESFGVRLTEIVPTDRDARSGGASQSERLGR